MLNMCQIYEMPILPLQIFSKKNLTLSNLHSKLMTGPSFTFVNISHEIFYMRVALASCVQVVYYTITCVYV